MFKRTTVLAIAAMMTVSGAAAQTEPQTLPEHEPHWEFIVNSGSVLPTGAQRDALERGKITLAQLSYVFQPGVAATASFGWGRTRDAASAADHRIDIFSYDVGIEARGERWLYRGVLSLSPFVGGGMGGRSYNYRSLAVDATHNLAGYASAGGELGIGSRVKLRLEARDYLTGFKPLSGAGRSDARNDLIVMAGLRLRVR